MEREIKQEKERSRERKRERERERERKERESVSVMVLEWNVVNNVALGNIWCNLKSHFMLIKTHSHKDTNKIT